MRLMSCRFSPVISSTRVDNADRCELDTHADTCCAGSNFVLYDPSALHRTVNVYGFNGKATKDVPITSVATAYDDPTNGQTYVLVFHQVLYFGEKLGHSLLNPNQLRAAGVRVQDVPRQFDRLSSHDILIPNEDEPLRIPLTLDGVISGFTTRKPTQEELDDPQFPHLVCTRDTDWDPQSEAFAEKEERVVSSVDQRPSLEDPDSYCYTDRMISSVNMLQNSRMAPELPYDEREDDDLYHRLVETVRVEHGFSNQDDEQSDISHAISAIRTSQRKTVDSNALAKKFNIGLEAAKKTIKVTTQYGVRNVLIPAERRSRQKTSHLRFPQLAGQQFSDTMFSKVKSTRQNKVGQVFTNGLGFDRFYPLKKKEFAYQALMADIHFAGIPEVIVTDGALEETLGQWQDTCNKYRIKQKTTVPYSPWQLAAERSIGELKKSTKRLIRRTNTPHRLWDYVGQYASAIRRLTALDIPRLDGRTGTEYATGRTPDISAYVMFDWYEPVYYWTPTADFPHDKKSIGRWLGVDEDCTAPLAFKILTKGGKVITRKDVWAIPPDELKNPVTQGAIKEFDQVINDVMGNNLKDEDLPEFMFDEDANVEPQDPDYIQPELDESFTPEEYDQYLATEVLLPHGGEMKKGKVTARKRDAEGNPVGLRNNNPILDTRQYQVEFPDGEIASYAANVIAENLYSQVDEEGRSFSILDEVIGHRKSKDAVKTADVNRVNYRTTKGWDMELSMKDGSTVWLPLKEVKNSNPVELAEYAVLNKLEDEPAFKWWVRNTLRRRDRIISKVKSRYWAKTHKYGVELPKTVKRALEIDKETGTDFWRKAIEKEMKNVMMAFEFKDNDPILPGWKRINLHMVFDIKAHDLTRKARLVAGGHMTDPPKESTYSSVVSRDSVRIAFLVAALNDLDVLAADVQNAYLNAPTKEKIYAIAGPEFGPERQGRPVYIVRALYGLKSSGARWRDHMAATLRGLEFTPCKADPDVWMRPAVKKNGDLYYEYILTYVDDCLVVSEDPKTIMTMLGETYTLKKDSVKEPDTYLGAEIRKWNIEDSDDPKKTRWAMSSDRYIKRAVADVETELDKIGEHLKTKVSTPVAVKYRPELDVTDELDGTRATYYMSLIGILRWACELGRLDILMPVAMMSRYMAAPREGHLEQVLHIFAYLKNRPKSTMVFDDTVPEFDENRFNKADWFETYGDLTEPIPPNAPPPRGRKITMTCFVDASHAGCHVTRRSWTGVLIFVNRAPILWYSKRQNTVESSTFTSEFIAARIATEMIEGLRYKLRMMGIDIDGPTNMFCDNESVVTNATKPESVLKKKHCAIAYHRVREAQAANTIRIAWEDTKTNLADIFTKVLDGQRLTYLAKMILW